VYCIDLVHDGGRANFCEHGNEPSGCIKYREFHYVRKR
jgi:hypothetical protein